MTYLVYGLIVAFSVKLLLTIIRWRIRIVGNMEGLEFQQAIIKITIRSADVREWGFRTVDDVGRITRFVELVLKSGKTFIYPINITYPLMRWGRSVKIKRQDFIEVLKIQPRDYANFMGQNGGLKRLKYDFWEIYSI